MADDVIGAELWEYYRKQPSFELVERDDGYIAISGGAEDYFRDYKDWQEHEKKAIKYAKGRCLDIGCGAGRVELYLQKKGIIATGIDTSKQGIKICRLRGVKNAKLLSINNVERLNPQTYDSVIMFGNNFGLFQSFDKAKLLLKKLYSITASEAVIIAESRDPYLTDDPVHFKYHARNRKLGRMPGQLHIRLRFKDYTSDWFDYLIVSKKEMTKILSNTGWKVKKFINARGYEKNGVYIAVISKI